MQTIYLIRHATPDWSRADLAYHIPPGPPLTEKGKAEARALGEFIKQAGVQHLFTSPLERCLDTARIVEPLAGVPVEVTAGLIEIQPGESEPAIYDRVHTAFELAAALSEQKGPVGLVTHGGPIMVLLADLGLPPAELQKYRVYDHRNPVPPGGAWIAQRPSIERSWSLDLAFIPEAKQVYY